MQIDSSFILEAWKTAAMRIAIALQTIPSLEAWKDAMVLLFLFALVALPVGLVTGFLQLDFSELTWKRGAKILITSLFFPAISEELFFRVLLLPHPAEKVTAIAQWFAVVLSLLLFVVYHPANAYSFFPAGRKVFLHPVFLFLAVLLGLICTLTYFQSGSLWTPVFLHWIVVAVWLLLLGGYQKLHA